MLQPSLLHFWNYYFVVYVTPFKSASLSCFYELHSLMLLHHFQSYVISSAQNSAGSLLKDASSFVIFGEDVTRYRQMTLLGPPFGHLGVPWFHFDRTVMEQLAGCPWNTKGVHADSLWLITVRSHHYGSELACGDHEVAYTRRNVPCATNCYDRQVIGQKWS